MLWGPLECIARSVYALGDLTSFNPSSNLELSLGLKTRDALFDQDRAE